MLKLLLGCASCHSRKATIAEEPEEAATYKCVGGAVVGTELKGEGWYLGKARRTIICNDLRTGVG